MKLLPLLIKYPRWIIAASIIIVSTGIFIFWMATKGNGSHPRFAGGDSQPKISFEPADVVLCGNSLVNFKTGEVVAREWLQGFGDRPPSFAKVFPSERFVVIAGDRGLAQAFGFDGRPKPMLQADSKPIGRAAYNGPYTEVIFVREGNLYQGKANWNDSRVESSRKITDTGYFRPDTFQGRWLWHEESLIVTLLGKTLVVNLSDGEIQEQPVNLAQLEYGMSPSGTFALAQLGGRELQVFDLVSGELKNFTVGEKVRKFLWLKKNKAVFQVGQQQFAEYDHATKKVEGPQQSGESIGDITTPSPDGNCFLLIGRSKITVIDLGKKKDVDLAIQFNDVTWLDDENMLCSCSAADTVSRGVWLVTKAGVTERLSNQPAENVRATGSTLSCTTRIPGGAVFVSGGELWHFDLADKKIKQVTHGQKLLPLLQTIPHE